PCLSPERGARIARRGDRGYREYLSEEQRREAGCPARELCREPLGRDTRARRAEARRRRAEQRMASTRSLMLFTDVVARLEDAFTGELPGAAAQAHLAPVPRRQWPDGFGLEQ